jgi:hypothetical protein
MIHVWRGFHHRDLVELLSASWQSKELVVLVPPYLRDFSFLQIFPTGEISFCGEWPEDVLKKAQAILPRDLKTQEKEILSQAMLGVFTSGTSSGQSRLVFYSQKNVQSSLIAIRELYKTARIQKIFSYPQPTHTFGLVLGYVHALLHGLEIQFADGPYSRKAHEKWLDVIDDKTLTLGTPTHFMDLLHFVKDKGVQPKASYSAIVGGARATQELWQQLCSGLNIAEPSIGYGATEASPGVTHLAPGVPPKEDGDIGYVLKGVRMEVKPDEGISFEGDNLCLGIYDSGEVYHSDKILLNDAVTIDNSGDQPRYTFIGRTDLIINRGGLKISLEVIEGQLATHFGCKCLAVSIFDERLGEDVGILIRPEKGVDEGAFKQEALQVLNEKFNLKLKPENIVLDEIPLNANGKFDRRESLKTILKKRTWKFPLPISHFQSFMPHRGPAIWVDRILETHPKSGVGEIILKENGNYFSQSKIRPSACIEWVAQTYGYVVAVNDITGIEPAPPGDRTLIAEVRNTQFYFEKETPKPGEKLRVEVRCTHDFGPLKVVEGKVFHDEKSLAQIGLKLYCGY